MKDEGKREDISLAIRVSQADYTRAYRRRFWRSLGPLVFIGAALPILSIARAPTLRAELAAGSPGAITAALTVSIGIALFLAFVVELLARSFSRYALRKAPSALAPQAVAFTDDGICTNGTLMRWTELSKVVETKRDFQLQLRSGQYMLLPSNQIPSLGSIRLLLRTHLGKRARLRD
jgi:hypothetical protein